MGKICAVFCMFVSRENYGLPTLVATKICMDP